MLTAVRIRRGRRSIGWLAVALGAAGLLVGVFVAPADTGQGPVRRLMYVYVPAAWTAYLGYAAVCGCSAAYLRRHEPRWDRYASAAAEIGGAMTALAVAAGSLWGRAVLGVWWSWDPQLVGTALLLGYAGHLAVRRCGTRADARNAAVVGVVGSVAVLVVYCCLVWWRSPHRWATSLAPDPHTALDPVGLAALLLSVAAFTAAAGWLFLHRLIALGEQGTDVVVARPGAPAVTREGLAAAIRQEPTVAMRQEPTQARAAGVGGARHHGSGPQTLLQ